MATTIYGVVTLPHTEDSSRERINNLINAVFKSYIRSDYPIYDEEHNEESHKIFFDFVIEADGFIAFKRIKEFIEQFENNNWKYHFDTEISWSTL